ncbi:MAG: nucleotide exchange factor GrpE [Bacteroidales bacterium]
MTKKKKQSGEETKHNRIDDNTDNKYNRTLNNGDYIDSDKADLEKIQGTGNNADSMKVDGEPMVITDKDVKPEVSVEEKLAEMQDRYLRLSAEFDNYRKRTLREKMELTKHAGENILISIIPVMDDFERALKLMENASDGNAMKSGIDLIYNKFSEFLKQNGLKEIEALNKDFNVDVHEAVTKVPVQDESMKGKVVEVVVKGYWLNDKVIRYSKVVVGE